MMIERQVYPRTVLHAPVAAMALLQRRQSGIARLHSQCCPWIAALPPHTDPWMACVQGVLLPPRTQQ